MAGFLGNVGLAAGRNIIVGQELDQQRTETDIEKQRLQMGAIALQQQKQQMETQQVVGRFIQSEEAKDNSVISDPTKMAQLYQQGAGKALEQGDFATANTMSELAKGKTQEAQQAMVLKAKQDQIKKEDLSSEADNFASNPTQEGYRALVQKAVAAGVNPTQIPPPNSPQLGTWVNQQRMASMSGKDKVEFLQKVQESKDKAEERKAEFQQREQDKADNRADRAMMREAMMQARNEAAADRKDRLQIEHDRLDLERQKYKDSQEGGGRSSVQMQRDTAMIAGASGEVVRSARSMAQFGAGTTSSPFMNLTDHKALDALAHTGANALTPEQTQMFQVSVAGAANNLVRLETAGGGRGATQAQINQAEKQIGPQAGDTQFTAAYKLATMADIAATRMRNQPPPKDPTLRAEWDKNYAYLDSFAKPDQIYSMATGPDKKKMMNFKGSYTQLLSDVKSQSEEGGVGLPGSGTGNGKVNTTPLPAGWSVTEH